MPRSAHSGAGMAKADGQRGMLRGQCDVPPTRPVRVPLHHDRHGLGGELHVGIQGIHDIPVMDADLGNAVVEDRAHGLGAIGPVTQRLPGVGRHLLEGVFERPAGGDKCRQQAVAKLLAPRDDRSCTSSLRVIPAV